MALKVGDVAPDFELAAVEDGVNRQVKLSDYRGKKNVVVGFHPLDWTPTCKEQIPAFNLDLEKFTALNAQVLDISVDSVYSHKAWQKYELGAIKFPMCADFYPHGAVTEKFGVMREEPPLNGLSERAVFIVGKDGKIKFAKVYPLDQPPDTKELLAELKKIGQ
jgi:alkyl hydroperoxide reductase subunit AhpC